MGKGVFKLDLPSVRMRLGVSEGWDDDSEEGELLGGGRQTEG